MLGRIILKAGHRGCSCDIMISQNLLRLRIEEGVLYYPWGLPAYTLLMEVTKRLDKWTELIRLRGWSLLKMIGSWYFDLLIADRKHLQRMRILNWPLPADLLSTSRTSWRA